MSYFDMITIINFLFFFDARKNKLLRIIPLIVLANVVKTQNILVEISSDYLTWFLVSDR